MSIIEQARNWQITEETKMVAFIVVVDAMGQKARQKKDVIKGEKS